jgi:hypothetical protein
MFRYRLHYEDGSDAGEATYAQNINPGDTIYIGKGDELRVLDVVPIAEEDSPFVALLKVEPRLATAPVTTASRRSRGARDDHGFHGRSSGSQVQAHQDVLA